MMTWIRNAAQIAPVSMEARQTTTPSGIDPSGLPRALRDVGKGIEEQVDRDRPCRRHGREAGKQQESAEQELVGEHVKAAGEKIRRHRTDAPAGHSHLRVDLEILRLVGGGDAADDDHHRRATDPEPGRGRDREHESEAGGVERQKKPGGEGGAAAEDDDARHALGENAGDGAPEPGEQRGDDDEMIGEVEDDGRRDGDPGIFAHRLSPLRSSGHHR